MSLDFCSVFVLAWFNTRGPQTRYRELPVDHLTWRPAFLPQLPKKPLMQVCCPVGGQDSTAHAFSVTSHDVGDPDASCFSICFSRPGCVCGFASIACLVRAACECVCVRASTWREQRTVASDLHYWRRASVACLTAFCEMLVLWGQTAEKQRV